MHCVQLSSYEYHEAISQLMAEQKFRCHVCCYNVPAAVLFFVILLGLCLTVVPLAETRLVARRLHAGLEFVHGVIFWLCALTLYMIVVHISKQKANILLSRCLYA